MRAVFLTPLVVLVLARPLDMALAVLVALAGAALFHVVLAPRKP